MSVTQTRADSTAGTMCWSCKAATAGGHFCAACGKIQPLPRGTSYFVFFGLPEKLQIDAGALEQQFHKLSWKLHPDNFVRASELERNLSLERSSELNDAYRALHDPLARVEYLLAHEGLRKEGAAKQQAPPELLEEVFELNESLDELREARASGDDVAGLRERLETAQSDFEEKLGEIDEELDAMRSRWDAAFDAGAGKEARAELMSRMNEILNRRSYIRNLVASVQKELTEA
ncbi:MAG: Fe-S protein assembly co-chaperone HscB [Candidatus Acidiferrales bacterium]